MICVPITSQETEALQDFRKAQRIADIVELRLDLMRTDDASAILSEKKKPVIATNRSAGHGGAFGGSEEERIRALIAAANAGADYADVELGSSKLAIKELRQTQAKIIVSYHNFHETPDNLEDIYASITAAGADIAKIAVMASDVSDNLKIFALLQKTQQPTIAFCMGPLGSISRILYKKYGGVLTYAALAKSKESAPGQITAAEMRSVYHADTLNTATKIFGVIGSPEKHSSSPSLFNAAYHAMGINAVHVKFPVTNVASFIPAFKGIVEGFAVTIPHKEAIIPHLDALDPAARNIGAVNTVVKKNDRLIGYNTDVIGGISALKRKTALSGKSVVLLGAGGAAKALAYGIAAEKGKLTILNRTVEKAKAMAKRYGCSYGALDELRSIPYDILINSTAVGMRGERLIDPELLHGVVMDAAYTHSGSTTLVADAIKAGCTVVTGYDMLVLQALDQFRMWTGMDAPESVMLEALEHHV